MNRDQIETGVPSRNPSPEIRNGIPYRPLGRTGEMVSALGLGGFHIGESKDEAECLKIIRTAIERGINFLDNCWDYNEGASEIRMGKVLHEGYRDRVFLMTKIDGQTRKSAARQIDQSLQRLQTDRVDLMQFHEIIRAEDPDRIFGEGGSFEAMIEAQRAGKVRFIGFTGHKDPAIHLKMLRVATANGFRFDAVQMPLNVMDAHFRSFEKQVLPVLLKKQIGVLGMKALGGGYIAESKVVTPIEALQYALNLPTSTVITGIDSMNLLDQALEAVTMFRPLKPAEVEALLARTAGPAATGKLERFKTDTEFDGTEQHREWLALAER